MHGNILLPRDGHAEESHHGKWHRWRADDGVDIAQSLHPVGMLLTLENSRAVAADGRRTPLGCGGQTGCVKASLRKPSFHVEKGGEGKEEKKGKFEMALAARSSMMAICPRQSKRRRKGERVRILIVTPRRGAT